MLRPLLVRVAALLDPTTRGWFTVLAGDLGRLLLGFGASILITRTLGPSRFGIYAVLGAIVALVGVFADAGLSQAANRYLAAIWQRSPERARKRGGAFFWLRLSLALLVVAAALLLTRPLIVLFDLPPAPDAPTALLLTLALAGVVAGALSGATATLLQITGRFQAVATTLVVNTGLTLLLAAVLAAISALNLVNALLLLGIVPSLVAALLGWRLLPGRWRLHLPSVRYLRRVAGTFLHFGRWLWLANLLTMLTLQLDLLLLNHFSVEVAVVGMYGLALNLANKLDIVNRSLYTVLLPAASALRGPAAYRRFLRRGLVRSGLICLLLLPAIPLAQPFILLFYGSEYVGAVLSFHLLLLTVALDVLSLPLTLLAFPLNRPRWLAASSGIRLLTLLVAGIVLIPAVSAPGAALARVLARLSELLFVLFLVRRHWSGVRDADKARSVSQNSFPKK